MANRILLILLLPDSVNCYGGHDGSVCFHTTGGISPYQFTWNPNVSADSWQIIFAYCTLKDLNGCDTTATIIVNQPPLLTLRTSGNITIVMANYYDKRIFNRRNRGSYLYWNGLGTGTASL